MYSFANFHRIFFDIIMRYVSLAIDEIQFKVFEKVCANKKFFIGDFRQMIYSFNGALEDVTSGKVLEALEKARDMGICVEFYEKDDKIYSECFSLDVLSPDGKMVGSNERSLVLYTEADGMRILTLGDLPQECEMETIPQCDILKVAHHGSRYATSRSLIKQALPEVAIISVGRNSYGHPTDRVLEDLNDVGAKIYRTDRSGCVTVSSGKDGGVVSTYINNDMAYVMH